MNEHKRNKIGLWVALWGWIGSGMAQTTNWGNTTGNKHPFMESMEIMMDAMGLNRGGHDSGSASPWPGSMANPWPSPFDNLSPWVGRLPTQGLPPFGQGFGLQKNYPGFDPRQWLPPMSGTLSPLEGIWQGSRGDLLVIRGHQFRVYATAERYIEGWLKIDGQQLLLVNTQYQAPHRFEYAIHEGRLVLRDEQGQLLLYRRQDNPAFPTGGPR